MRSAWVSQSKPAPWFGPISGSSHTRLTDASNEKDDDAAAPQPRRAHLAVPGTAFVASVAPPSVFPTRKLAVAAIRRR